MAAAPDPDRSPFAVSTPVRVFLALVGVVVLYLIGVWVAGDGPRSAPGVPVATFAVAWVGQAVGTVVAACGAIVLLLRGAGASGPGVPPAVALSSLAAPAAVVLAGLAVRGDGWPALGLGLLAAAVAWRTLTPVGRG